MLSEDQRDNIVVKLNDKINIPILSEKREEKILEKLVTKLDELVAEELSPSLKDIWDNLENGVSEEDRVELTTKVVEIANNKINLPLLNENQEKEIIRALIEVVIDVVANKAAE